MTDHNELFSDLAEAGRLSRRLVGEAPRSVTTSGGDQDGQPYLRFRPQEGPETPPATPPPLRLPVESPELASWQELLTWAVGICGAKAAFVVDAQGFIIADTGDPIAESFRGAGADLGFATEQLTRFDDDSGQLQSVELQYENCHLVVVRVEGDDSYLITLVSPTAMSREFKITILQQATHLATLDR